MDVTIFKGERFKAIGKFDVKPFAKKIDPHSYLHYSSAHPKGSSAGVVGGKMIRMLRHSSSPQIFAEGMSDLMSWFEARGYPKRLLKEIGDSNL